MEKGFSVTGRKDTYLTLRKKDIALKFDRIIKSGAGKLVGIHMTPTDKTTAWPIKRNVIRAHDIFAHAGEAKTRATAQNLGWTLTKKMGPCTHCARAKAKIKPISILTSLPKTQRGHILAIDISHIKYPSIRGKWYWLRVVDLFTNMKWSCFISKKSNTSGKVIGLIQHLKATKNVTVKIIRCNKAGENKSLQRDSIKKDLGLTSQFSAPYTHQHNWVSKRAPRCPTDKWGRY